MSTIAQVRQSLIDTFEGAADHRTSLADRHPDDAARNLRSANSLRAAMDYVKSLPDDDPTMLRISRVEHVFFDDVFAPHVSDGSLGYQADRDIFKCGFHGEGSPESFLRSLAESLESDAEIFKEAGSVV